MNALNRIATFVLLLVLLGVGIRLMYYGLETVVGSSPHYDWPNVLWMLAGVVIFLSGIISGILLLGQRAATHP